MKVSIVIPALNVGQTIRKIVTEFKKSKHVDQIIVVDNGSTDETLEESIGAGASVVHCIKRGLGYAMKCGIHSARNELVMKVDGDIRNPQIIWTEILKSELAESFAFANGIYHSDYDEFPVGNLVAKPAIRLTRPNLQYIKMPLSGLYMFRKSLFNLSQLPNNWAFDVAMAIYGHDIIGRIGQADIGPLYDKQKRIIEYSDMAHELLDFFFNQLTR